MKLNISYPPPAPKNSRDFTDKKISQEVPGNNIPDELKGYVFRIYGGGGRQSFQMKQGVLLPYRIRLLLARQAKL